VTLSVLRYVHTTSYGKKRDISHRNFPHNTSPNVFNVVYICHIPSVLIQNCFTNYSIHYDIYNDTFGRLFYPKWCALHSRYVHAFPGNQTHDLELLAQCSIQTIAHIWYLHEWKMICTKKLFLPYLKSPLTLYKCKNVTKVGDIAFNQSPSLPGASSAYFF